MSTISKTILHVIGSTGFGGGERYLLDLIRFSSMGYRHVAAAPHHGPLTGQMDAAGYDCRVISMPRIPSITSIIRLCRICRLEKVDIVHSHGFRANLYGRLAAVLCRKPHVATVHVSLYDYLETPPLIRCFYRLVEKYSSPVTRRFICISESMAADLRRLGIRADRMIVVENGIDADRFSAAYDVHTIKRKFGISGRHPVIGTVGRLVSEKGQIFLIEALPALTSDFPELACLFVGDGPLSQSLKQTAMKAGVPHICRFTGPVADVAQVYAVLDVFILPSLREPFGLAALEAMASGVAVIATDAGGPAEYIRPEVNGMLVPPGRSAALADAISRMLADRSVRESLARAGRQTVTRQFDIRKTVEKIEAVYAVL